MESVPLNKDIEKVNLSGTIIVPDKFLNKLRGAYSRKYGSLISIIASSQVNASLCSLQYALNEQLTSTHFSRPLKY